MIFDNHYKFQFNQDKIFDIYLLLITFFSLTSSLVFFNNVPSDEHYYVSAIAQITGEKNNADIAYSLIKTPIYDYLYILYNSKYYLYISHVSLIILSLFIYLCFSKIIKNNIIAIISSILVHPIIIKYYILLAYKLSISATSIDSLLLLYPQHYGWTMDGFSARTVTGISLVYIYYNLYKRNYFRCLIPLPICYLAHPNNAFTISIYLITVSVFFAFSQKKILKLAAGTTIMSLLFLIVNKAKLSAIEESLTKEITIFAKDIDWYWGVFINNYTNFSVVGYLIHHPVEVISVILIILLFSMLTYNKDSLLALMIFAPVILYFVAGAFEYVAVIFEYGWYLKLYIPSQIGLKILELSFLPIVIAVIINFDRIVNQTTNKIVIRFIGACLMLIIVGNVAIAFYRYNKHSDKYFDLINHDYDYIGSLLTTSSLNYNPTFLPVRNIDKPLTLPCPTNYHDYIINREKYKTTVDTQYENKYSNKNAFEEMIKLVRSNLEKDDMLIAIPYFARMRDIFYPIEIYYQEIPDASLMLASPIIYSFFSNRLFNITGLKYGCLISKAMALSVIRNSFPSLIDQLKSSQNRSLWLLTESGVSIDHSIYKQGNYFNLYKL
jgi:hypothetical protein